MADYAVAKMQSDLTQLKQDKARIETEIQELESALAVISRY